jgi:hypothetical protein
MQKMQTFSKPEMQFSLLLSYRKVQGHRCGGKRLRTVFLRLSSVGLKTNYLTRSTQW